jgi:hypothetical protein
MSQSIPTVMYRLSGGGVKSCGVSECEIEDDVKRRAVLRAVAQLSARICTYPLSGEVADAFCHPENLGRRRIGGALGHVALSLLSGHLNLTILAGALS